MNFKLIENSYIDWESIHKDFAEDYLNTTLTNDEIREKYGMTHNEFRKGCNIVKKENNIRRRPFWKHRENSAKYYYKLSNGYMISKRIGEEQVYLGFVPSLEIAKIMVCMCEKVAWDIATCKSYCKNWREHV